MAQSLHAGYGGFFPNGTDGPESPRWDMKLLDLKPVRAKKTMLPGLSAMDSSSVAGIMTWDGLPVVPIPDVQNSPAFKGASGTPSQISNKAFEEGALKKERDLSGHYLGPEMAAGCPSSEAMARARKHDAQAKAAVSPRESPRRVGRYPGDQPSETSRFLTGMTAGEYEPPRPHLFEGAIGATMEKLQARQIPYFYGGENKGRRALEPLPPEERVNRNQSVGMPPDVTQDHTRAGARSQLHETAPGWHGGKRQVERMNLKEYHCGPVKEDLGYEAPFSKTFPKEMQQNFTYSIRGDCLANNTPKPPPPPRPPPLPRRPRMLPDGSVTPR